MQSNNQVPQHPIPANFPQYIVPEDEISLIDLWLVIVKHKRIFWIVFGLVAFAGLAAAMLTPKKYSVISTVDIGQTIQGDMMILLESPETVKAKLENALVPLVLEQYDYENIRSTKFDIRIPKNSNLMIIENKVTEGKVAQIKQIQNQLIAALEADHERIIKPIKEGIKADIEKKELELRELKDERFFAPEQKKAERDLNKAETGLVMLDDPVIQGYKLKALEIDLDIEKSKLESLNEKEGILEAKKTRLTKLGDLLVSQIKVLEEQIKTALSRQQMSLTEAKDEPRAMTMLMIDNELQQNRNRLAGLEERLYVELENQHAEILKEISDIKRQQIHQIAVIEEKKKFLEKYHVENKLEQEKQKSEIAQIKAVLNKLPAVREQEIALKNQQIAEMTTQLDNIIETKTVSPPMRSQMPTGGSKKLIVALAGVLGGVLGLFSVFATEFHARVKSRQLEG